MTRLVIESVSTGRQRKQFLHFPWQLYDGDPNWVPPIRMDEKELVGYAGHHPFLKKNRVQTFLALRDGVVCGRIAGILNQVHNEYRNERRGFFGFFECEDDQEAANGLFNAVLEWFADQGIRCLRGPANPGVNYIWGTLVEGFDSPPTFMMAYNPPYYGRLIEGFGFSKAQDLYAYWGNIDMLPAGDAKRGPIAAQIAERFHIRVRPLEMRRFKQNVRDFLEIYNQSMIHHWGFSPMSPEELDEMVKVLRYLVIPELVVGAEIDGKLVGMVMACPTTTRGSNRSNGKLFPLGFLRLFLGRRKIKKVRVLAANVLPEYHLMGVALVLLRAMVPTAIALGMDEVEFSWVAESNLLSRGSLEKAGTKRIKTYRVYDREPSS